LANDFKIRFDGEQNQIDANTLINSLIHTTSIIQELNRNLESGKKIDVKIKALEKGSFLVHIDLIETSLQSLKTLLTKENIEIGAAIIAGLVGLIEIKKFLKGKKAQSKTEDAGKVIIENVDGNVLQVENFTFNIYENNTIIRDALSQNFETLENDPSISSFEITDNEEIPLVKVDKDEFHDLAIKSEQISDDERIITEAATLNIVRLSFDEKLKWEFYFKGNKISARIDDQNFYKLIEKGESFAKGDTLEVEFEIRQKFDSSVNTYINKSYAVKRILRHIKRDEQSKINFSD